ncbi:hypothetical protein F5Y18DRAFT_46565 [Xylariaceae sp. FL1019]|nr:hypothetical protein F5Y18DRAFT_46565 [Xylariaceae sp. FL1019]
MTTFTTTSEVSVTDSVTSTSTFTITEEITIVSPTTITLPPTTVTNPPQTVTSPPQTVTYSSVITAVNVCPIPTNAPGSVVAPYDVTSDLTWGCPPGYVCDKPFTNGCNVYADLPDKAYVCENTAWCKPSPAYPNVTRDEDSNAIHYPPTKGYYNLDPAAFGLSDGIFGIEYITTTVTSGYDQYTTTIGTGDWTSQASITHFPPASTSTASGYDHKRSALSKRDDTIVPWLCYDLCNSASTEAQSVGKSSALCKRDSVFYTYWHSCLDCIDTHEGETQMSQRTYLEPEFAQWLDFCVATTPNTVTSSPGQGEVTTTVGGTTVPGGQPATSTSVEPITSSASSSSSSPSSSSLSASSSSSSLSSSNSATQSPASDSTVTSSSQTTSSILTLTTSESSEVSETSVASSTATSTIASSTSGTSTAVTSTIATTSATVTEPGTSTPATNSSTTPTTTAPTSSTPTAGATSLTVALSWIGAPLLCLLFMF